MDEIAPGIWRWTARHPEWHTRIEWGREVASFALVGSGARALGGGPPAAGRDSAPAFGRSGTLSLIDPLLPAPGSAARARVDRSLDRLVGAAARLDIMITIPYHARSAEELLVRYRGALPTTIWGHRAVAGRFRDPATVLAEIAPGRPVGDGILALAIGKPRRFEMPLYFPAHRALAFGDAVIGIDGGLRVWQQGSTDPVWHNQVFVPTLRPLLDLDVERVLVTHGPPVLRGGRKALEAAMAAGPWDYRSLKD
jgi:hypothetical protein